MTYATYGGGSIAVLRMLSNIDHSIHTGIRQGFFEMGDIFSQELNEQTKKKPRAGRTYRRRSAGGRRRRHTASRPGETPASFSGNYRRGRGYKIRGWRQLEFGIRGVRYSKFLEEGTRNMAPRPGVRNAYNAKKNQIVPVEERAIRRQFKR